MMNWRVMGCMLLLLGLLACSKADPEAVPVVGQNTAVPPALTATLTPSPTFTPTATPTITPSPTVTPSPTFTPSPTPTPTATAVPLTISGNPRDLRLHDPIPQGNAPCGLVDILDFPVDPPDAAGVSRGGQDFGIYRSRYEKNHAGEDWSGPGGRGNNFGTPVYSSGHGLVTYAEPEGWNRDKGVVIIRHAFVDGSTFLSFYGHLDPPSVVLKAGDCIARGEQIGNIGQPRSSPHLHFEIRTHMAYTPGPGYWPSDPRTQGWLPPSQTIWEQRIESSPGVAWTRPFTANIQPIGPIYTDTMALLEGKQLVSISLSNGRLNRDFPITDTVDVAAVTNAHLVTANRLGHITAYQLPDLTLAWQMELEAVGTPLLLPLPGGSVAVMVQERVYALSADGDLLWQRYVGGRPFAWTTSATQLVLATNEGVWLVDGLRPLRRLTANTGYPVFANDQLWLYSTDGLYRWGEEAELLYALPNALLQQSAVAALPDGGVLLAHADIFDRRLIAFNADGSLRWQRSLAGSFSWEPHLLTVGDRVYLVSSDSMGSIGELQVYGVDVATAVLTHIFTGGTRTAVSNTWAITPDATHLLINIGGGHMFAFDPQLAQQTVLTMK